MNLQAVFEKTLRDFAQDIVKNKNATYEPTDDEEFNNLVTQNKLVIKYTHQLLENYHNALLEELSK